MGVYFIWDLAHIIGVGRWSTGPQWWRAELRELKIMENLNFNADAIIDPKDAEIKNLREQVESADAAATLVEDALTRKSQELDAILSPLFSSLEPRIDALIESRVNTLVEDALNDFEIYNYEGEIGDMIDERLPEGLDDESRSDDLKAAIKEVLAGATLTMDIE
jgi:hypothetical protein